MPHMPRSLDAWHSELLAVRIQIDNLRDQLAVAASEQQAHDIRNRMQVLIARQECLFLEENVTVDEPGGASWLACY